MDKRTKIIATIGPASSKAAIIERMVLNGMDIARLNFSHGTHKEHAAVIKRIRAFEKKSGQHVGIHADLGGPKIRTGIIPGDAPLDLKRGDAIVFAPENSARGNEIPITFPDLACDVKEGNKLLLDDGNLSVEVKSVEGDKIHAIVIDGGVLKDHKGINLPGLVLSTSAVTKKDLKDLTFALSAKVDFIGVSFVQKAEDIEIVKKVMKKAGRVVPVVAKIERSIAVKNLEEIAQAADAVMVARGDLGVETPMTEVPLLQKDIIAATLSKRKPVIVATQMLESMITHPRPTRAEVTDVSNAVFESADAVMLSAETSIGVDPPNAVSTMKKIVMAAEESRYAPHSSYLPDVEDDTVEMATARAACFAAEEVCAKVLVVFTSTGNTARLVAAQRPLVDIVATTYSDDVARRTQLYWGITSMKIPKWTSIDSMINTSLKKIRASGKIKNNDTIVVTCGNTAVAGATNIIKVLKV